MDNSAAALVAVKAKLGNAIGILKRTYNNPDAFTKFEWNERFWVPPKLLRAQDAMLEHRLKLIRRALVELQDGQVVEAHEKGRN